MKKYLVLPVIVAAIFCACDKNDDSKDPFLVTFEDTALNEEGIFRGTTPTGRQWSWGDEECTFTIDDATFVTAYNDTYGSWGGMEVSNNVSVEDTYSGYENDKYAFANRGANGTEKFLVVYDDSPNAMGVRSDFYPYIKFPVDAEYTVERLYITNNAYFYWYARNGKGDFMGGSGFREGDYFGVEITGYDKTGAVTGTVKVDLADYCDGKQFLVEQWSRVDLWPLGAVNKLTFGVYGTNLSMVPGYFCIDEIYVRR